MIIRGRVMFRFGADRGKKVILLQWNFNRLSARPDLWPHILNTMPSSRVTVYLSVRPVFDLWDRKRDCLHYSVSGISLVVNSHNCCRHAYKHMDVGCQFLKVGSNQLNLFGPSSKRLLCSIGAACQWESIGSLLSLCVQVIYPSHVGLFLKAGI